MKTNNKILPKILVLMQALLLTISVKMYSAEGQHVHARLMAEPWDGQTNIRVLIHFTMDKGWRLFWKNPGDSGSPPELTWNLPEGFKASALSFPVPEKLKQGDEIMFGYTHPIYLMAEIRPPKDYSGGARGVRLEAMGDWLVGRDRSVRESIELSCAVPDYQYKKYDAFSALWMKSLKELPLKMRPNLIDVRSAKLLKEGKGRRVTLVFRTPGSTPLKDFYPDVVKNAVVDLKSIEIRNGAVSFLVFPKQEDVRINTVSGIVVLDTAAYFCTCKLS